MIKLDDITVSLPAGSPHSRAILKNITLTIEDGEWLMLVGGNGSGKSTFLGTLAGLWPVASGKIDRPSKGIALLLQEPDNQFIASSVQNELLLSLSPELTEAGRTAKFTDAVDKFSLGELLDRNPHELSGGEKQRVALATVWIADPEVLLLDEPTAYLDAAERERCVDFVTELNRNGVTVIWAALADGGIDGARRTCYLDDGTVVDDCANEESPSTAEHSGWGDSAAHRCAADDWDAVRSTYQTLRDDVGRVRGGEPDAVRVRPAETAECDDPVITLQSASFAYEGRTVLRGVTAEVCAGDLVAVSGRNGSGKTTLLSAMSGILDPAGGTIYRKYPKPVDTRRPGGRPEQMVFHLFQNPERLFFAETVYEEMAFGLKALKTDRREIRDIVSSALERANLDPGKFLERMPLSLSLGEMRRLAFAMASALRPQFLLLDEPTSCLDASGCVTLANVLSDLLADGCTVVIASNQQLVVEGLGRRIIHVEAGRIDEIT